MTLLDSLNTIFLTENIFSYILLLVIALMVLAIGIKMKYGSIVAVPIGLLTGVYWLTNGLGWHFIVLLFASIGVMLVVAFEGGKR